MKYANPNPDHSFTNNINNSSFKMMGNYNSNIVKSFGDDFDQEMEVDPDAEYYGRESLIQQTKMYKMEYYKVLEWNKTMKKTIAHLEE